MHQEGSSCSLSSFDSTDTSNSSQTGSPKVPEATSQSMPVTSSAQLQNGSGGGEGVAVSKEQCSSNGSSDAGSSVTPADHDTGSRRKRPRMQYYNLNGCLECEVKDAEIRTLRRRIQVMEEVVALLNQKLSAIQQSSNSVLFSPMIMPPVVSQVVIPSTYTTPPTTSVKVRESYCCTSVDEALHLVVLQLPLCPHCVLQNLSHAAPGTHARCPSGEQSQCYHIPSRLIRQ